MAFADCAVVIDPGRVELAEIAIATADTTRRLIGRGAGGGAAFSFPPSAEDGTRRWTKSSKPSAWCGNALPGSEHRW